MAFITFENEEINETTVNFAKSIAAKMIGRIKEYRAERKELRSLYGHHSENAAHLEQAERDVNRIWLG